MNSILHLKIRLHHIRQVNKNNQVASTSSYIKIKRIFIVCNDKILRQFHIFKIKISLQYFTYILIETYLPLKYILINCIPDENTIRILEFLIHPNRQHNDHYICKTSKQPIIFKCLHCYSSMYCIPNSIYSSKLKGNSKAHHLISV